MRIGDVVSVKGHPDVLWWAAVVPTYIGKRGEVVWRPELSPEWTEHKFARVVVRLFSGQTVEVYQCELEKASVLDVLAEIE